ncbi:zinc-binding dehydrogenase [Nocardioides donggukensis]|uniref:zinc-binding dehydrogenase n=1 Tax=Nocardioides donggukensis TaxID=2774019 RepID=UPI00191E46EF|nr:zinc-binding dehydrogenase [Nocardioides donggukensis]
MQLTDVPDIEARLDQAVVAIEAFAPNRGETFLLDSPAANWRPGKDVAGTVVEAALDGSGPDVGTRVVAHLPQAGWAERALLPQHGWAALPPGIATTTAAALPLAGLTALRLLRLAGPVVGRSLLITGASGGVGHYLTEMATSAGADVTAITRTHDRGARLRELGARTMSDLALLEATQARFDVAFESIGGDTLSRVRHLTSRFGRLIWFGQAGREPMRLDFFDWVDGDVGAPIEQFHYAPPSRTRDTDGSDLQALVTLVNSGRLHPEVDRIEPWTMTGEVIDALRDRRIRGKAVLTLT